jgi:hypothetical protein
LRLSGKAGGLKFAPQVVLTNSDFRFIVTEQLAGVGIVFDFLRKAVKTLQMRSSSVGCLQ